jgi:hypothetical protein
MSIDPPYQVHGADIFSQTFVYVQVEYGNKCHIGMCSISPTVANRYLPSNVLLGGFAAVSTTTTRRLPDANVSSV